MSTLNELAVRYKTDKRAGDHNYVAVYEPLFEEFRHDTFNFLEIGIYKCASLRMWRDWFPSATIYGIDKEESIVKGWKDEERMVLDRVNQGDPSELIEYAKKGPWRIIIDDGSHYSRHQKLSFDILWDRVEPGGYYIIEDTFSSYAASLRRPYEYLKNCNNESLMQRMLRLTDEVCGTKYDLDAWDGYTIKTDNKLLSKHQKEIEYMKFHLSLLIIKKRGGEYGGR